MSSLVATVTVYYMLNLGNVDVRKRAMACRGTGLAGMFVSREMGRCVSSISRDFKEIRLCALLAPLTLNYCMFVTADGCTP